MKNRGTFALIVCFFAGLIGLWWADHAKIPTRDQRIRNVSHVLPELTELRPDDLHRIEISGGEQKLVFERRAANRWQIVEPIDAAADPSMVESLAFNLKRLEKVPDSGTLNEPASACGLAPPARTVRLFGPGDAKVPIATLEVGSMSQDKRYVRPDGFDGVQVVEARLLEAVDLPATRWRDRALFRIPSFQAQTIAAERPDRKLVLEREGEFWKVLEPYRALADDNRVEGVLAELGSLRVSDGDAGFIANDVRDFAPYGLDKPTLSITVGLKTETSASQTVHLGKPASKSNTGERWYARRGDQDDVVVIDPRLIKDLGINPAELHGKKVADVTPSKVSALRLVTDAGNVCVARRGRAWERIEPLVDKADSALVEDLLKRLSELEASLLFSPDAPVQPDLEKPWAAIEVWQEPLSSAGDGPGQTPSSPPRIKLLLGRRDGAKKTVFARNAGDPTIFALPISFLDGLIFNRLAFRDRQVASVPAPSVERIATTYGGKTVLVLAPSGRMEPTAWRLKEPAEAPADRETVERVLLLLSNLRAESFITDQPAADAAYGFDKPELVVRWTTRGEVAPVPLRSKEGEQTTLTVGNFATDRKDTRYARVSSSPIVFSINPEAVGALESEWRERLVMTFGLKNAQHLTLRWPRLTLNARPVADLATGEPDWVLIDPPAGLDFDPARIKSLVKQLSKLTTFRYAQYDGPIKPETGLTAPKLVVGIQASAGFPRELRVGNRTPDGYLYATTEQGNSGLVFLLPLGSWEPWQKPPAIKQDPPKAAEPKPEPQKASAPKPEPPKAAEPKPEPPKAAAPK
jgi:hypothetical protein